MGAVISEATEIASSAGKFTNPKDPGGPMIIDCVKPIRQKPKQPAKTIMKPTPVAVPTAYTMLRPHRVIVIIVGVPPPMPSSAENPPRKVAKHARGTPLGK